jgi:GNAT superfamily N-acetyltransferase
LQLIRLNNKSANIKVKEIDDSNALLKQFYQLGLELNQPHSYRKDSRFGLFKQALTNLDNKSMQKILLAYEGDKCIARLVAYIVGSDDNAVGFLALFEAYDRQRVVNCLFDHAIAFFEEHHIKKVFGPEAQLNEGVSAFSLNSHKSKPFLFEPDNNTYYPELWEEYGFLAKQDYYSRRLDDFSEHQEFLAPFYEKALANGFFFRAFNPKKYKEECQLMEQLSKACQNSSHLAGIDSQSMTLKPWLLPNLIHFVCNFQQKPIGFIYALPNFTQLRLANRLKKEHGSGFNVYCVAVLPRFQRLGLARALFYRLFDNAASFDQANLCLLDEGGPVDRVLMATGDVMRRYRSYHLELN